MESSTYNDFQDQDPVLIYTSPPIPPEQSTDDFPSQFGGNPLWLYKPPADTLFNCVSCKQKLTFLCQLYSPLPMSHAYERALYVFFCQTEKCKNKKQSIVIYRLQHPKSSIAAFRFEKQESPYQTLSQVYGIITQEIRSEELRKLAHQINKQILEDLDDGNEIEEDDDEQDMRQAELPKLPKEEDEEIEELENEVKGKVEDPVFEAYKGLMQKLQCPVAIYSSNPLYFKSGSSINIKQKKCKNCKGYMRHEFQINSPVLEKFQKLLNFQWGVIFILTCEKSCEVEAGKLVQEEFQLQIQDEAQMSNQELQKELERLRIEAEKREAKKEKKKQKRKEKKEKQAAEQKEIEEKKDEESGEGDWD